MIKHLLTTAFLCHVAFTYAAAAHGTIEVGAAEEEADEDLDREERAAGTFPPVANCTSCSQYNATGQSGNDKETLLQCCDAYGKCCQDADRVPCPSAGQVATGGGNACSLIGPFCRRDADCRTFGTKCCPNTDPGPNNVKGFKCCWSPAPP